MTAFTLRIVACIAMLIDHIGYACNIQAFRIIGRIAFPIFLFLIYNGYLHTSCKWRYALRLALFALISQVPFSLFTGGQLWISNGNVFVTLLICLLCLWISDVLVKQKYLKYFCILPWIIGFGVYYFGIIRSDYGAKAVLMALCLFLFYGKAWWKRILLVLSTLCAVFYSFGLSCIVYIKDILFGSPASLSMPGNWALLQVYSLLAFLFIFAYNGKKGGILANNAVNKCIQYGFYLFYPVHMLLIWWIFG